MAEPPVDAKQLAPGSSSTKRRLIRRIIVGVVSSLLLVADVGLSHWDELFGQEQCDLVTARNWYQRLVTLGYRKPKPHFVGVVTVKPPDPPDACEYRSRLADLVGRIGNLQPTMVVLDYSFSRHLDKCPEATNALQKSIDS